MLFIFEIMGTALDFHRPIFLILSIGNPNFMKSAALPDLVECNEYALWLNPPALSMFERQLLMLNVVTGVPSLKMKKFTSLLLYGVLHLEYWCSRSNGHDNSSLFVLCVFPFFFVLEIFIICGVLPELCVFEDCRTNMNFFLF